MFPATSGISGYVDFTFSIAFKTFLLWPWAESSTKASTCASTNAAARSITSGVAPIAAAQSSLPPLSLAEFGYLTVFDILDGNKPFEHSILVSYRELFNPVAAGMSCASLRVVPTGAVTRLSFVITSSILWEWSVKNRMSVCKYADQFAVPANRDSGNLVFCHQFVCVGNKVVGRQIKRVDYYPVFRPFNAVHLFGLFFDCHILMDYPNPPSRAIAIAIRSSVTVSIAAVTNGIFSLIS